MTCFSNKDKKKYSPKYLWYASCEDEDLLKECCPEDIDNPTTPEGESEDEGDDDKLANSYFHVEIF